jgi:hypothetical protein
VDPEFDESLDREISELLAGEGQLGAVESDKELAKYAHLAAEISRVITEESPRLSTAAHVRNLALLRARSTQKRAARRLDAAWLLHAAPRWVQIAAVAIIVVIIANGITVASASSLPGSPLYAVKRLAEQSNVLFAPTAGERARIWMDLASRRLDEVQRLLAQQPRVDPGTLDAIDESILRALTETAGTRGTERIALLQQIIQLAVREQIVLDELALQASEDDRPRFQETSRLMANVAHLAGAAEANPALPLVTPTSTPTTTKSDQATGTLTWTSTVEPRSTSTSILTLPSTQVPPSKSPPGEPTANRAPATEPRQPGFSPTPRAGQTPIAEPTETPEAENSGTPQPQKTSSPEPEKTDSPEPNNTEPPEPQQTQSPDHENTVAPQPHRTGTPDD